MYRYEDLKPKLFTEDGVTLFVAMRDHVRRLLVEAGAVSCGAAMRPFTGDTWLMLACLDRMVELRELHEVTDSDAVRGQDRIFIKGDLLK